MATIVTRAGKGSALSHNEVDANFTNLNTDKLEANTNITVADATVTGNLTVQDYDYPQHRNAHRRQEHHPQLLNGDHQGLLMVRVSPSKMRWTAALTLPSSGMRQTISSPLATM